VNKSKDSNREAGAVKIDFSLLEEVEKFINREENKFKFVNKKQFVDIAVHDFLEKLKSTKEISRNKKEVKNGKKR